MSDDRVRKVTGDEDGSPKSRTQRLVEMFQRQGAETAQQQATTDARQAFVTKAQQLGQATAGLWTESVVQQLLRLAAEAVAQAERAAQLTDPSNPFAQAQVVESLRAQLRQIALTLNPPQEVVTTPAFQQLMDSLRPRGAKAQETGFDRETMMKGKTRADVLNRQVHESVNEADRATAKQRVARLTHAGADPASIERAQKTLAQLSRLMRKRHKKKAQVDENGNVTEVTEPLTQAEVEELANAALELMRTLREEFAPKWAPAQQPWFLNAADNEVYSIILAVAPKELFAETEAWGRMQELRSGEEVFTLRAADKLADAVRRK
jgi:hypothetical protein